MTYSRSGVRFEFTIGMRGFKYVHGLKLKAACDASKPSIGVGFEGGTRATFGAF
jgi:hypothetical protein